MPHFLFKKPKTFSINFEELEDTQAPEEHFWEIQRAEALDILTTFFSSWQSLWNDTKRSLGDLNLSEEGFRRLTYYENEQRSNVIRLLARILVSWEKDERLTFEAAVICLAKELRPSLLNFETDQKENFTLSDAQLARIDAFKNREALSLKNTIRELQRLSWYKFEFGDKVLTLSAAKDLIEEKLHLTYFDFLDFKEEPDFHAHGFFPSLLQDSADFGL